MLDQAIEFSPNSSGAIVTNAPALDHHPVSFAGFRLESDGTLFRDGNLIHLPPKELAALRLLVKSGGQIISPNQLKLALWGDVHVTADSVPKCMSSLRAHLQPDEVIQTVYKRGYRFVAEVRPFIKPNAALVLPRLAIPPFTTEPGVPEHLGVVIAEETTARLSNAPGRLVSVLARDSVFNLSTRGLTAVQVGEALKSDLVLAGSLRALTDHFRLRVEMIHVPDGVQIWVEDLLVDREKVAGIENELASRLDFRLKTLLMRPIAGRGAELPEPIGTDQRAAHSVDWNPRAFAPKSAAPVAGINVEIPALFASAAPPSAPVAPSSRKQAFELYLRGHHEWQTLERHRMQDGQQNLARAIDLDPSLLAAKIDMVNLCVTQAIYGFAAPSVSAEHVRRTVGSISDFAREAPGVLPSLAWTQFHFDRDLPGALRSFALAANLPHDPWTTRARSMFAISRGRFPEAIEILNTAIHLDPFAPWLQSRLAWTFHLAGRAQESVEQVERAARLHPEHEGTALYGAIILAFNGQSRRAIQLAEMIVRRQPYFDLGAVTHAYALACAGRSSESRTILERIEWLSRERFVLNSFTPAVHLALGEVDAAIAGLRAANHNRCPWFFQILADPRLKGLHGNPGFEQLRFMLPQMENAAEDAGV